MAAVASCTFQRIGFITVALLAVIFCNTLFKSVFASQWKLPLFFCKYYNAYYRSIHCSVRVCVPHKWLPRLAVCQRFELYNLSVYECHCLKWMKCRSGVFRGEGEQQKFVWIVWMHYCSVLRFLFQTQRNPSSSLKRHFSESKVAFVIIKLNR